MNTFFTEHDTLAGVRNAATAELNIIVSEFYGVAAGGVFAEVHDVPFVTFPLPIGPSATADFLSKVGKQLQLSTQKVEEVIAGELKQYYHYVERVADSYNDLDLQRYAVVVGDGNYAPALTRFLADDLGWLPELTVVTEFFDDDRQANIHSYLGNLNSGYRTRVVFETDASEIANHLARHWPRARGQKFYDAFSPAFVVGSHLEREFAQQIGAAHLTVTYPVGNRVVSNRGYTGYEGSLQLIEDLFSVLVAGR